MGPTVIAVGTGWRPHDSCGADRLGRVRAVAARSAGARSASLDAAKAISDLAATRSQLLTRSPRRRGDVTAVNPAERLQRLAESRGVPLSLRIVRAPHPYR